MDRMDLRAWSPTEAYVVSGGRWPRRVARTAIRYSVLRFLAVSAVATVADFFVLLAFARRQPQDSHWVALAVAVAYLTGTLVNFLLARRWVFPACTFPVVWEFVLVVCVAGVGLALTESVTLVFTAMLGWPLLGAKALAVGSVFAWNFSARRVLVYRDDRCVDAA